MNWFRIGAGPGRIFPPVDGGEGGFMLLLGVCIVVLVGVLLWWAGVLSYVASVTALLLVVAFLVAFACIVVKIAVESYRRRWPLG